MQAFSRSQAASLGAPGPLDGPPQIRNDTKSRFAAFELKGHAIVSSVFSHFLEDQRLLLQKEMHYFVYPEPRLLTGLQKLQQHCVVAVSFGLLLYYGN
jgi:hypothetical protein